MTASVAGITAPSGFKEINARIALEGTFGHLTAASVLRKVWHGQFKNSVSERSKDRLRVLLRESFMAQTSGVSVWARHHSRIKALHIVKSEEIQDNPILVPILTNGYYFAASVAGAMSVEGKSFDFVMLGCHRGIDASCKDMELEPGKIYITMADEAFLKENSKRPILLLDDACESGKTMKAVLDYMVRIGHTNVFMAAEVVDSTIGFIRTGFRGLYKATSNPQSFYLPSSRDAAKESNPTLAYKPSGVY